MADFLDSEAEESEVCCKVLFIQELQLHVKYSTTYFVPADLSCFSEEAFSSPFYEQNVINLPDKGSITSL
jgi:hypothetical protein